MCRYGSAWEGVKPNMTAAAIRHQQQDTVYTLDNHELKRRGRAKADSTPGKCFLATRPPWRRTGRNEGQKLVSSCISVQSAIPPLQTFFGHDKPSEKSNYSPAESHCCSTAQHRDTAAVQFYTQRQTRHKAGPTAHQTNLAAQCPNSPSSSIDSMLRYKRVEREAAHNVERQTGRTVRLHPRTRRGFAVVARDCSTTGRWW